MLCRVLLLLKSQDVEEIFFKFLRFCQKRAFAGKFLKLCSERIHFNTDRRVLFKFREIWPTGNGKNRALLTCQKNFVCLSSSRYCAIVPRICQGQPPTMYSECSRFYPNRFTFGVVRSISERTNTIKTGQLKTCFQDYAEA